MITLTEFREMMAAIETGLDDSLAIEGVHFDPDKWKGEGDFIDWRYIEHIPIEEGEGLNFAMKITGYVKVNGESDTLYHYQRLHKLNRDYHKAEDIVRHLNKMMPPGYFPEANGEDS